MVGGKLLFTNNMYMNINLLIFALFLNPKVFNYKYFRNELKINNINLKRFFASIIFIFHKFSHLIVICLLFTNVAYALS